MNAKLISSFKRANTVLNQTSVKLQGPGIKVNVHYWGFMPEHFDNVPHRHSFFEACYVMEGQGTYMEEGHDYELQTGTAILSRPGTWHQIRSSQGMALCYVAFELMEGESDDTYRRVYRHLAGMAKPVVQQANATPTAQLWTALTGMFDDTHAFPSLAVHHTGLTLLLSLLPLHGGEQHAVSAFPNEQAGGNALFRQAKLFVDDNISENLTLQLVANHLHISPRQVTRLFSQGMNQSFVQYIQGRRIQMAVEMLLQNELEIKDIAERCGFESVHYFTRVFSRKLGVAPARFRRSQLSERRSGLLRLPVSPTDPTLT